MVRAMRHLRAVSRVPKYAIGGNNYGNTSIAEEVVIMLLTVFFSAWENFPAVIQNLQKYYRKTPN